MSFAAHPVSETTHQSECFPDSFVELMGWGTPGFTFVERSLITYDCSKKYKVKPFQEVKTLEQYLKSLEPIYRQFFGV